MPSQGKNQLEGNYLLERVEQGGNNEVERKVAQAVEPKGCHDDVVEEQQRILENILKEKKEEELNQQLIRSLCSQSHGQSTPLQSLVQPQPISRQHDQLREELNCWEKVSKRKKQAKFVNQSTTNQSEKNVEKEAFAALRKKESEEQQRRGSRSNTHQKVILVPNFTEETVGPTNCKAAQECSVNAPELSLANQRRRVSIICIVVFFVIYI